MAWKCWPRPPGLKLFFDRFGERYAIDWLKQAGGSEASLVFAPYHANK